MSIFHFGKRKPVYDPDKAAVVIFAKIPEHIRRALDHPDIDLMLKLETEYQEELEHSCPPDQTLTMDHNALVAYIMKRATFREKNYTEEQVSAVLDAEVEYMKMEGLIEE